MQNHLVLSGPKAFVEEDARTLCALFPQLDMSDAYAVLRQQGSIEKAANVLVDVEVVEEKGESGEDDRYRELPKFLRCPKCYSPDILLEDETETVVCIKCHHHFIESQAKKGAARSGSGRGSHSNNNTNNNPKKGKKPKTRSPTPPSLDEETPHDGPVMQKLQQNRAEKAANPTLRLVVSYAGSPKERKVIHIPHEDGYVSLMKQVLVTLHCDTPKSPSQLEEEFPSSPLEVDEGSPTLNLSPQVPVVLGDHDGSA
eukprot:TRINITY_DN1345_c0_g1_i3.p1 TRINITY_DN1345_c0_g1~~TRINITY_DN1345_c0_g1_i3.p1  ORF type:complete len:279 (+),score=47.97 TRINITY_DN1345_c0_g1_i3:72-839(+)